MSCNNQKIKERTVDVTAEAVIIHSDTSMTIVVEEGAFIINVITPYIGVPTTNKDETRPNVMQRLELKQIC